MSETKTPGTPVRSLEDGVFYGNFGDGRGTLFHECLAKIRQIFQPVYASDNLIALGRSAGFLQDTRFRHALLNNARTDQERSIAWRLHTLTWAANHCLSVPGDFVECGVWHGFSFAVLADYLQWQQVERSIYLYDTFVGIPPAYNSEGRSNAIYDKENQQNPDTIYNSVVTRFAKYNNVRIVRGIVPDTFAARCPSQIAFLHLDMNAARSEIAALDALWDKIAPGGMIVFDDYGWSGYSQQKVAEDAWMAERNHTILELPTGQGVVIKRPM
ncbi:methyltransferase [Methylobacterium sp. V23]|nr:methyltransferase [Methylobacterium sp. V23]